ncbi:MAG: HNH endonuclease [Desulfurellales bacterium]|nr:MAG: HNH endonuclease [Desulfurellales bacterium]
MDRNKRGQFLPGTHWREDQPFRHKAWLENEYVELGRSTGDIARQFGVTDAAILFWLRKHGIPRRSVSQARSLKHWGVSGPDNPMWNRRGELNPRWLGGITPERQAFYTSQEWKSACSAVWKRDDATCQRCRLHRDDQPDMPFHIHHITSFAVEELRADLANLVLLCEVCHQFVHSRGNVDGDYLSQERDS